MNLNLTLSKQVPDDGDHHLTGCHFHPGSGLNHHHFLASKASSSLSLPPRHAFFGFDPDRASYYRLHLSEPHQQEDHDPNYVYNGGSSCGIDHKANCEIPLNPTSKEENHHQGQPTAAAADMVWEESKNIDPLNWMSSKEKSIQRAMKSMQKLQASSSSLESELSSNGLACVNSYSPIRVCTDCNTSKTPLWRSGPKGPKSLCNACGIRQRKARRAMAAAAAAAAAAHENKPPPEVKKIKEDHNRKGKRLRAKKWPKMAAARESSSNGGDQKKMRRTRKKKKKKTGRLEEFLINLSNSLALHKVFPQDEKDAAILLMALSSGLVHS